VDIVIGTHGLLSASVRYRDLGLLIVDEEQKFGVRQKEHIKQLKTSVDVLTLTATPVPRTLYLALSGLRDISTIHTPPPGRREVLSEVSAWQDGLVAEYIERELRRGGQVFFVHNRIRSINAIAVRLRRLLPGIDLAVAHGQMPSPELERLYLEFATGEHRLLLSTAIIESGLDLPNVNTIIVDRADTFGLADLHQLRGRVGRSGRQAYALFLVPREREITGDARKRLSALLAYSQLGAGFKLALRDLEIRGAGDLLGLRQHGQVARVGLNLYAKMLGEAAAKLRGEQVRTEPQLALDITAFLPADYVQDSFERVALYRRLLGMADLAELGAFREELADRFGRYPTVVENLFRIARVRILACRLGLLRVELKSSGTTVVGTDSTDRIPGGIDELLGWLSERTGEAGDGDSPPTAD
jgi:transcription-repair coupling factor (superfamily II helicase)